ncbi:type VI immunity family protein [Polyangium fumosum]|uniref:DUF3396 domain-containing protein n=1 Tax=Polyangium fumosum TaxID=889272 RepID=A0A4V5PP89_9BACT|nr:type VI immunity family protein [Polyangium fumosum]TKD03206.1 DUF3396 domain-containing protein [Polyangium fumosum]
MSNMLPDEDLKSLSDLLCIRDTDGRPALMIGLMAYFYFREPWTRPVREAVTEIADEYLHQFEGQLKWIRDHRSDRAPIYAIQKRRVALPRAWLPDNPDGQEWGIGIHGGESERAASDIQIQAFGGEYWGLNHKDDLGHLYFYYPLRWLADHPGDFQQRVLHAAQRLKPFHGYAGVGFLEPVSLAAREQSCVLVTPLASRFPGIEVNAPISHGLKCQHGIKGVNWLTILSDHFVEEAGGYDYLRIRLDEPNFPFYKYDGGLMIQAGPHPEVGDATQNRWPRHYVTLAKVLKKIQVKEHGGFHLGGPGLRMNKERAEAWLFRFDGK